MKGRCETCFANYLRENLNHATSVFLPSARVPYQLDEFETLSPPTPRMRDTTAAGGYEEVLAEVCSNFGNSDPDMNVRVGAGQDSSSGFVFSTKREDEGYET